MAKLPSHKSKLIFEEPVAMPLIGLMIILFAIPLWGYGAPPTPGTVQETLKPPAIAPSRPSGDKVPGEVALPAQETKKKTSVKGTRRVKVERFVMEGNTLFSEETLRQSIKGWEGRELTLNDIYHVSDVVADVYHAAGYSLAVVTVPAQKVNSGTIRLEIIEGKVGKLLFGGNQSYSNALLTRQLDQIEPGEILRLDRLEQEVLLLNSMPGLTVRTKLDSGEAYGTTDIQVNAEEKLWNWSESVDNYGLDSVGKWRLSSNLTRNNPFRYGDVLTLGFVYTESDLLNNFSLGYGLPIGYSGGRLDLSYSWANYAVGGDFANLAIRGKTKNTKIQYTYPWWLSRQRSLYLGAAISRAETESWAIALPLTTNTIDLLELSTNFSYNHPKGTGISTLTANFSTNFESNPDGSKSDAQAGKLELNFSHDRPLSEKYSLVFRSTGVMTLDPLADTQKFSLGGPSSIRGFVSSEIRGDQGISGTLELRRFLKFSQDVSGMGRLFLDSGKVYCRGLALCGNGKRSDTLSSLGTGLSLFPSKHVSLDLQLAKPIDGHSVGDHRDDGRIWLMLSTNY